MTIILKENTPEIRKNISDAGIMLCCCTSFRNAVWLDYSGITSNTVHGVGYSDENLSSDEECDMFLANCKEPVFCKSVDEFITKIKETL